MNQLKLYLGILCIVLAHIAVYYLVKTAASEIAAKPVIDTKIQWGVFVLIFIPIAIGLALFGYFALTGEYDRLPERSDEISD